MKCIKCGSKMNENDRFCFKCGAINYNHPDNESYVKKYGNYTEKKLSGFGRKEFLKKKRKWPWVLLILFILFVLYMIWPT